MNTKYLLFDKMAENITVNKIVTRESTPTVQTLCLKYQKNTLSIPLYQRHFVWDIGRASRLIESILLDIPIPLVYFAEDSHNNWAIIDGQQRIGSIIAFIDGYFPFIDKNKNLKVIQKFEFRLKGLEELTELEGKKFNELPEEFQNAIYNYPIKSITVLKENPENCQNMLFERINTGTMSLNDMELWNCQYRGPFMDFMKYKLAENQEFIKAYYGKLNSDKYPEKRMNDVKAILQFIVFSNRHLSDYDGQKRKYIANYLKENQFLEDSEKFELFANKFEKGLKNSYIIFGHNIFKRYCIDSTGSSKSGHWKPSFNDLLFETWMVTLCNQDPSKILKYKEEFEEAFLNLMTKSKFVFTLESQTNSKDKVNDRFALAMEKFLKVKRSVDLSNIEDWEVFPIAMKQTKFFDLKGKCEYCGEKIVNIRDAEMHHIIYRSKGGKTTMENAMLVHRICHDRIHQDDYK